VNRCQLLLPAVPDSLSEHVNVCCNAVRLVMEDEAHQMARQVGGCRTEDAALVTKRRWAPSMEPPK